MPRRRLLAMLGGALLLRPIRVAAQATERVRRVGFILAGTPSATQPFLAAFRDQLRKLGWVEGRNLELDVLWDADAQSEPKVVDQVLALHPDVIFTGGSPVTALHAATHSVPIVFVTFAAPLEAGLAASLAHPGGNVTGFTHYDAALAGKWLELLKEIAPQIARVTVLATPGANFFPTSPKPGIWVTGIEQAGYSLSIPVVVAAVRDAVSVQQAIASAAAEPKGGLIVLASNVTLDNREAIVSLAAQYRLPATYWSRDFCTAGGLLSYAVDYPEQYRLGAGYVDRILRGDKPGDLPIQQPTNYKLVINLRAAKALGLTVPPALLARADEVIE